MIINFYLKPAICKMRTRKIFMIVFKWIYRFNFSKIIELPMEIINYHSRIWKICFCRAFVWYSIVFYHINSITIYKQLTIFYCIAVSALPALFRLIVNWWLKTMNELWGQWLKYFWFKLLIVHWAATWSQVLCVLMFGWCLADVCHKVPLESSLNIR